MSSSMFHNAGRGRFVITTHLKISVTLRSCHIITEHEMIIELIWWYLNDFGKSSWRSALLLRPHPLLWWPYIYGAQKAINCDPNQQFPNGWQYQHGSPI